MDYISDEVLNKVIVDLTSRAKSARKARFLIGGSIILIASLLSGFISYRLTSFNSESNINRTMRIINSSMGSNEDGGLREYINRELEQVYEREETVRGFIEGNGNLKLSDKDNVNGNRDSTQVIQAINKKEAFDNTGKLVDFYTKIMSANNGRPINKTDDTYSNLISTIALSAGIVGFLLYILQIAVSFIRYYSRLAELYDSQKTALIACDGNLDSAKVLMGILSNDHIGLGKEPTTLYGKALDVIGEMAKSKKTD
ncbi:hypothetical protein [Enterobacter ludwigii]